MAGYNKARFVQDLLQRTEGKPPSFTVNLYPDYWSLNNGSRFHYHIPMASLLDDIRAQRIPVDFLETFDSARVPFYDGCMIVQLLDYRPQNHKDPVLEKPEQTRVVLHPSSESLWADICSLNQRYGTKWTDMDALEVEARALLATNPPLCLDPDPHLARIANHVMRASMPAVPASLKRKAAAMEPEDDETDKARRIRILQHMAMRPNRTTPSFQLFDAIQKARQNREAQQASSPVQQPPSQYNTNGHSSPAPPLPGTPTVNGVRVQSPVEPPDDKKKAKRKKSETPQAPFATTNFTHINGSQIPVPSQTTHHFVNAHPPSSTAATSPSTPHNAQSPLQIPVYSNVQAVPDSTLRVPTPSQPIAPQYTPSPRPHPRTPVSVQQAPPQPQPQSQALHVPPTPQAPKVSLPAAAPNFPAQQVNQHFLPQQPHARNGAQKPAPAPNLASIPAQSQFANYQILAQIRNLQQQQRLQVQKQNGRATPQTSVPSPAQQPQANLTALSPAHQASSPLAANQQLARSPMPSNAPQPTQMQAAMVQAQTQLQQSSMAQTQLQQSSMSRSPAQQPQQPPQAHGQHPGYGQFNLRKMMQPNGSATHQALQAAVVPGVPSPAGRTGTPSNSAITDHRQHPGHSQAQVQLTTHLSQPSQQTQSQQPQQPHQPHQQQPQQQPQPQPQPQTNQHSQQPLSHSQLQQLYPQLYGYPQAPFNIQGSVGRIPQAYWSSMNMANIAGIQGIQGIPGMQGVQGMGGIPHGLMASMQGRGIPMSAQQMAGMTTAAGGAGHVGGANSAGSVQGKAAVQGGMQR
ncbi:hypothetical protein AX15_007435 [Amanita polypyramis BW_CC]|nr:hypothetical protein AX15_007435 [Amanita polypyramis BW_CC]